MGDVRETRRVRVEFVDAGGARTVSATVADAPPLGRAQRDACRRSLARRAALPAAALKPAGSLLVRGRRYDVFRAVESLETSQADILPLVTFALRVEAADVRYERLEGGPPFPLAGLETLPPERAAERLAVFDCFCFDARQAALEPYCRRAAASPDSAERQYELALMIWHHHFIGAPGDIAEAEGVLLRALARKPGAAAGHGLLGEIRLRDGRARAALPAFVEAARLQPRHPRFHYCASVAHGFAGDAAAADRALALAKRVAGPKLARRFTSGSNPLEDYRYSLLCEAVRLRARHGGAPLLSKRELAERDRADNRIRRSRVPKHLRRLVPLAEKWGVGDDGSRGYLLRRATRRDKQALRRVGERHAQQIQDWLDSQLPERPTPETGAFLYLLEAIDEI
jgi:hypothetical protein